MSSRLIGKNGVTEELNLKAKSLGLIWCRHCKKFLEPELFYETNSVKKRSRRCSDCTKLKSQEYRNRLTVTEKLSRSKKFKDWRINHPDKPTERRIKRYGASLLWYKNKEMEQNHSCAICLKSFEDFTRKPCIDHNHQTGVIRGLLCSRCNIFIGMIETGSVEKALKYLEKYNG